MMMYDNSDKIYEDMSNRTEEFYEGIDEIYDEIIDEIYDDEICDDGEEID